MDPRDTAPDSWELEVDTEGPAPAAGLPTAFAALNVNAKPFVPNVNAPEFVPSFFQASAAEMPASDGRWRLDSWVEVSPPANPVSLAVCSQSGRCLTYHVSTNSSTSRFYALVICCTRVISHLCHRYAHNERSNVATF